MKKILVISYFFAPASKISAIRWTKMSKYLTASGKYDVDVIAGDYDCAQDKLLAADAEKIGNVIRIKHADPKYGFVGVGASSAKTIDAGDDMTLKKRIKKIIKKNPLVMKVIKNKVTAADYNRSLDFFEQTKKYIKENGGLSKYDAVISSYGPTADALIAVWIKENYPEIPLIIDFRDPMVNKAVPKKLDRLYRSIQDDICRKADRVVLVARDSDFHFDKSLLKDKLSVITNGYDGEDFADVEKTRPEKFTVCFSGSFFPDRMDLTPLFEIIRELTESGEMDISDVEFDYAGSQFIDVYEQAKLCSVEGIMKNLGFIDRKEALKLQKSSDILAVTVQNSEKNREKGVLTGKLFEYIASGSPIAAFVRGETPDSEIREIIERGRFGAAYEEANRETDHEKMKKFILDAYTAYKNGESNHSPDKEYAESFDYKNLAADYDRLIESIVK